MAIEQIPTHPQGLENPSARERRRHPGKYPASVIPVVVQPGIGAPTQEEIATARAGEYAPRGVERFLLDLTRNRFVRLLAGGTVVGGAVWVVYENIPAAVHQFVDERFQDVRGRVDELYLDLLRAARETDIGILPDLVDRFLPDPNPDIFDPSKALSRVTTKNSIGQSIQNITIRPVIEATRHKLTIPIPLEIKDDMALRLTGQGAFHLSNIPEDTEVVALIGGKATFRQTINRDGVQTFISIMFPDGEGYYRNLIYTTGDAQLLIPGATETTDYNYDGTPKVTRRILTTYIQPGKSLISTLGDSNDLHINVSPGAMDSTGGPAYKDGKGLLPINFGIWPLTKNNKAVFINP